MRAAICPEYGPPEVVRVEEHAVAEAGPGQVGVRVQAAAVNFPDVLLVAGSYQVSVPPPFVPGSEFAGVVDEVGSEITGFAVGDRVTGTGMFGAFAERVVVDAGRPGGHPRRRGRVHGGRVRRRAPHGLSHAAFDGAADRGR